VTRNILNTFLAFIIVSQQLIAQEIFPPPSETAKLRIHAHRTTKPLVIDGNLTEVDWQTTRTVNNFIQSEPFQGQPAKFDTEVRILFDDENIYIGAFCRDTTGINGVRVQNLRRDFETSQNESQNESIGIVFDTFRDPRTPVPVFFATPYGSQSDMQIFEDRIFDSDWDAIWRVRTSLSDSGWTAEFAIPWSSLRYPSNSLSSETVWGINFSRVNRRLNQITRWSPVPRAYRLGRMVYGGLVIGLEPPPQRINLRAQPYGTFRLAERTRQGSPNSQEVQPTFGGEAKWAPSANTVLDLTVNTDFAQADADRQVVNLSRFSVFFPERRQFFLENASLFAVGSSERHNIQPFFSRRIGLDDNGNRLGIDAGLRLVNQTASYSTGGLLMRQRSDDAHPTSWFGVGRYTQNIGTNARLGALATVRHDEAFGSVGAKTNAVGAVDGFMRLSDPVWLRGMLSLSSDSGSTGFAGYAELRVDENWIYAEWKQSVVSSSYNPGVGFVDRTGIIRTSPAFFLNWRPSWMPSGILFLEPGGLLVDVVHRLSDGALLEANVRVYPMYVNFRDGGGLGIFAEPNVQVLTESFEPLSGISIAPGRYNYIQYGIQGNTDPSAPISLEGQFSLGGYFNGQISSLRVLLRTAPIPHVAASISYRRNELTGVGESAISRVTHLFAPELRLSLNPQLQFIAFWQYNTAAERSTWNARFSWEFEPLSYVFVVFNDNRTFDQPRFETPFTQREAIIKISYLRQL
jgi:hypothetical protein